MLLWQNNVLSVPDWTSPPATDVNQTENDNKMDTDLIENENMPLNSLAKLFYFGTRLSIIFADEWILKGIQSMECYFVHG